MDPNERIEHLINRRLDGELTGDERVELDRALMRSPEHRAMLELSKRIDAMCAVTIADGVGNIKNDVAPIMQTKVSPAKPRSLWWALPVALAACVGWLTFSATLSTQPVGNRIQLVEGDPVSGESLGELSPPAVAGATNGDRAPSAIRQASTRGRTLDRRRDTELLGVMGDDGRIYLIEVTRTQAYSHPSSRSGVRLASEGL